jgi:hypothetical protein
MRCHLKARIPSFPSCTWERTCRRNALHRILRWTLAFNRRRSDGAVHGIAYDHRIYRRRSHGARAGQGTRRRRRVPATDLICSAPTPQEGQPFPRPAAGLALDRRQRRGRAPKPTSSSSRSNRRFFPRPSRPARNQRGQTLPFHRRGDTIRKNRGLAPSVGAGGAGHAEHADANRRGRQRLRRRAECHRSRLRAGSPRPFLGGQGLARRGKSDRCRHRAVGQRPRLCVPLHGRADSGRVALGLPEELAGELADCKPCSARRNWPRNRRFRRWNWPRR